MRTPLEQAEHLVALAIKRIDAGAPMGSVKGALHAALGNLAMASTPND